MKPKARKKEIIKMRADISDIETKKKNKKQKNRVEQRNQEMVL